ncbi:MAG: NAD(P)/FAD-dependent oxidoreductase [Phycisphaeraceae bacterium]
MQQQLDIAIVGAGAAGLMAAICAGRAAKARSSAVPPLRIAALDGAARLGAKILIAGGGRCNVTHDVVAPTDFAGGNVNQIAKVLRSFSVDDTVAFFRDLGVTLKREETGKLFPTTDRAQTVLNALLRACEQAGVALLTNHRVATVMPVDTGFELETNQDVIRARRVILATGGKSLPKTGSDGYGYELARELGHTVTRTMPGLVPLVLEQGHYLTTLSGVSMAVELTVRSGTGKVLHRQSGAMLLTHFGLSGPAVLDISRHLLAARSEDAAAALTANLMPGEDFQSMDARLVRAAEQQPRATVFALLRQVMPERLADQLPRQSAQVDPQTPMAQLSKDSRRALVRTLVELPLPVTRDRGFLFAEVTAGGVPLEEVSVPTMASRRCPGLYLCGEILDVDGRIGGYNFQWAWCTGRLAGLAAART